MKFSLVLATLGRTFQVKTFLESLDQQSYRNFELIVVDQNPDDRLEPILWPYSDRFAINHLRSKPGLSLARNIALNHITGDVVAFPDDDCAYPSTLLEQAVQFFTNHDQIQGLVGRSSNLQGQSTSGRWDSNPGKITPINVWRRGTSFTIFLRQAAVAKIGPFDELLGVGAQTPWGSGEDIDYLLRAIAADCELYYDPGFAVIHPTKPPEPQALPQPEAPKTFTKTYAYAMGRGRLLRKHPFPFWFVVYNWLRPGLGLGLALLRGRGEDVRSYWATLQGRFQGWLGWA